MTQRLLTTREVADLLQCSAELVRVLCRSGQLRCVRLGKGRQRPHLRIPPEALQEYLREAELVVEKSVPMPRRVTTVPQTPEGVNPFPFLYPKGKK